MKSCDGLNREKEATTQIQPGRAAMAVGMNLSSKTSEIF